MGLPAPELGEKGKYWIRVTRLAREPSEHHARMCSEGVGEAGAREELLWVAVVLRGHSIDHLFESDRELIGAEGATLAHLLTKGDDVVPGFQMVSPFDVRVEMPPCGRGQTLDTLEGPTDASGSGLKPLTRSF